ncbi:histone-lysine N-methyltransferase SETMAR [Trichonephila clavipes]|nr:histone-lysine N-methyltransferase SETMAR [Trichonephila clavipes]
MMNRISIRESLSKRNEISPFLIRMVTGDEKLVTYYNIVRNDCGQRTASAWPNTKFKSVLSTTGPLKQEIDQKWPELATRREVVFHQDNARSHTFAVTRQNLWELGSEVLMHPPYSPDLALSDYHLFLALKNFLSDKKLKSREDYENRLLDVFTNKGQDFYERVLLMRCKVSITKVLKEGRFDPATFRSVPYASTLSTTPKRSSSRDV